MSSRDAAKKAAAVSLSVIISRFLYLSQVSFENLIGQTDKIIEYFESDEFKGHIKTLSIDDRVATLKIINNECKEIYSKKMDETGRRNMPRKAIVTRRELNIAYDDLVEELNARARIDGDADYLELFAWWNAMIDKYRIMISLRSGAQQGGKPDGGESNIPYPKEEGSSDDRPVIE